MFNTRIRLIRDEEEAKKEIERIGSGKEGIEIMAPKAIHRVIMIEGIDCKAANILKQEILAVDGECAVSWDAILSKEENSPVLLMGTLEQYSRLIPKLKKQPFGLKGIAEEIKVVIENFNLTGEKTKIMGILNLTPDSFSHDGLAGNLDSAVEQAKSMVKEGAEIIDVGGESTRPGAEPVSVEDELERVIPVIEKLKKEVKVPVSIDTYKTEVAAKALQKGASIVNDINGLRTEGIASVIKKNKASVVIMHMQGTPRNMQENPSYGDVVGEIIRFLRERTEFAINSGIKPDNIIIDPGIGFGKTTEHNLEIINRLREFKSLGFPVLVGVSRKSFIGNVLDLPVEERLEGTLAAVTACVMNGANIVRVHDVKEVKRVVGIADAIKDSQSQ